MDIQVKKEGKFEYVEQGEGPVIIVLHGLFGALSNFKDVIQHFSPRYKVVIPIMPLYTLPLLSTSVNSLAEFIRDFIQFKGYQKVNLLGNSLGGHVALVYTLSNMEKVNTLTLTGSSGLYENAFGGSFPRRDDRNYLREKISVTFYDKNLVTEELVDEVSSIVGDRNKLVKVLALAKSAIRHNMGKDLHKYNMPVCLIWGKNDTITPPEVADDFHKLMKNSDLFWIDKCGHAPMMEHPSAFNKLLDDWLTKVQVS